jgi:FAD/FMN-containing dehydrogenase
MTDVESYMIIELGVVLDLARGQREPDTLTAMARLADEIGLDLAVITAGAGDPEPGLDPWTTAVWLVASTSRIQIGVAVDDVRSPDPRDPEAPTPAMVAKAGDSLDAMAPGRLLTGGSNWVTAPRDADVVALSALAESGLPVVVPVDSADDVARLAEFVGDAGPHPRRRAAVRARRLPGIDYDGVPESLSDAAIEPGDAAYRSVRSTYLRGGAPGLVLRPRTPAEVSDAVAFARRHTHLALGIRSAGHGVSGRSTNQGGLVIDVGAMNTIVIIDHASRLVRIGPGATWKQVAAALDPYGWALGSGDYGGVGVGGLATAGGIGLLSRKHGLTIDHLRAVELVLADGTQVRASAAQNPDLFWAVRGAGANFGIATAFEFEVDEVDEVGWAQLVLVVPDIEDALRRYGELAGAAPRDTTVFLVTGQPRQEQSVIQLYAVVDNPDPDVIVERLIPFAGLGMLARQQVVLTPYHGVMAMAADVGPDGQQGFGDPVSRSALIPEMTPEFVHEVAELLRTGEVYFLQFRAMGGAIADVPADATAFAHRDPAFQLTAMGASDGRLDKVWAPLKRYTDGLYLSFETDRSPARLADAFPPPVLRRLRELKRRYDPANLFHDNFAIDPDILPTDSPLADSPQTDSETAR